LDAIAQKVDPFGRLSELLAPIRERLMELDESEDEAVEYFEQVKHERRRERRAAGK
jgi:hypothetical protein